MSSLLNQIKDSMKDAMRAKDKLRLNAIRMLLAQVKQVEVDQRIEVTDAEVLVILDKMMKQRRDSIAQFETAGRTDLVDIEKAEAEALQQFMPQPLSDQEIAQLIQTALTETQASEMRDMGKVMAILKPKMQGRADLAVVSGMVKSKLG